MGFSFIPAGIEHLKRNEILLKNWQVAPVAVSASCSVSSLERKKYPVVHSSGNTMMSAFRPSIRSWIRIRFSSFFLKSGVN